MYKILLSFFVTLQLGTQLLNAQALPGSPQPVRITTEEYLWGFGSKQEDYFYDANGFTIETHLSTWNADSSTFYATSRSNITNNPQGKPSQIITQVWNAQTNQWSNQFRETWTYNTAGNPTLYKKEYSSNGQNWNQTNARTTTTYTTDQQLLTQLAEVAYGTGLVKKQEIINEFNTQNQLTTSVTTYYGDGGVFQQAEKFYYTYDTQGRKYAYEREVKNANTDWFKQEKEVYTYTTATGTQIDFVVRLAWFEAQMQWLPVITYDYTYAPGEEIIQELVPVGQHTNYRHTKKYNTENQLLLYTYELWVDSLQSLKIINKSESIYNTDGSYILSKTWHNFDLNGTSQTLNPITFKYFSYDPAVTGIQNPLENTKASIFPNPTSDWVQVKVNTDAPLRSLLFNAQGKLIVESTHKTTDFNISLKDQPPGTYFLHLEQNGNIQTIPILKQ